MRITPLLTGLSILFLLLNYPIAKEHEEYKGYYEGYEGREDNERPEWLRVDYADATTTTQWLADQGINNGRRIIGFANRLSDPLLRKSLETALDRELPESFTIFKEGNTYYIEASSEPVYMVLETSSDWYENDALQSYELMLLDKAFVRDVFAQSHPAIVAYVDRYAPFMLGLIRENIESIDSIESSESIDDAVDKASMPFRFSSPAAIDGGGQCEPICGRVFNLK